MRAALFLLLACMGAILLLAACAENLVSAAFDAGLLVVLSPFLGGA